MRYKRTFILKVYSADKYKWTPIDNDKLPTNNANIYGNKPYYCSAIGGSQGQDWITTYCYDVFLTTAGELQRLAYVECDYVE